MSNPTHVVWHEASVKRPRGCVLWFTGLSGSGKSTIANAVDRRLHELAVRSFVLDGDNIRHGLNASPEILLREYDERFASRFGLGFSADDRAENVRRIGCVAELFCAAGIVSLTAFVSPWRAERDRVRRYVESCGAPGDFVEIFVDTPLDVCEHRDPKGLYRLARAGKLKQFTGIDDPYETPLKPEITLAGDSAPPDELAGQVIDWLRGQGKLL
jgi:adenylylsulfate kinase